MLLFIVLVWKAPLVRQGAAEGLRLWTELLIPSLLPFFTAAGLMNRLGFTELCGKALAPAAGKLFAVSPAGASVFLLGLSGGYPLGSRTAAELVVQGRLEKNEAERLLAFADNSGPAFAVGAIGLGIFQSARWGLFLWGVHVLAAVCTGILLSGSKKAPGGRQITPSEKLWSFGEAFADAAEGALRSLLSIGASVIFFCSLLPLLDKLTPADARLNALLRGCLELSSGIGAMRGMRVTPDALALAAFLLGWGGLCVHLQAAAVTKEAGLSLKRRFFGKLLHGILSAVLAWALSSAILR